MIEVSESHAADVMGMPVRRALPRRQRRTVGAWCFVDHMGPVSIPDGTTIDTAPHPHVGLQTVTWLLNGEAVHRDSLGSEQTIRPGQLNLMTAGNGIAHSEEGMDGRHGPVHGVQLWVAQPDHTRHGASAFEHHAELPIVELPNAIATVLVGSLGELASPARRDTDHVGVDLQLRPGRTTVGVDTAHEHAVIVVDGAVRIADDQVHVVPGHLAYLGLQRSDITFEASDGARLLLLGGTPFESTVSMWWNFVARTHDEIDEANDAWRSGSDRFGDTGSRLARIPSPDTPWRHS